MSKINSEDVSNWNDFSLAGFFSKVGFFPTPVLNLELNI